MNSRIQALVEQAGMTLKPRRPYIDEEPDGYLESDIDYLDNNIEATRVFFEGGLERFAELIVQECLDIVEGEDDGSADTKSVRLAMIRMKKHFGVEE